MNAGELQSIVKKIEQYLSVFEEDFIIKVNHEGGEEDEVIVDLEGIDLYISIQTLPNGRVMFVPGMYKDFSRDRMMQCNIKECFNALDACVTLVAYWYQEKMTCIDDV